MTIEQELKNMILKDYGSLREFVSRNNLKYTTVDSILKRGIMNSNINNVMKICDVLNISVEKLTQGKIEHVCEDDGTNTTYELTNLLHYYFEQFEPPNVITLDGKPLTDIERDTLVLGISIIIEQIRRKRR